MARGVHGQAVYVDPKAEMVIARYASFPMPANGFNDPTSLPAYHALVEMRYFAGLTIEEAADALGISAPTAKRDWAYARAWLHREIRATRG